MAKFVIGNQVTLACSDVKMQVENVDLRQHGNVLVQCVWISNDGTPQSAWYDERNLDLVE